MPPSAAQARKVRQPTPEDFASARLLDFTRYMWPNYKPGQHHRLIAEHLEAVDRGEIKRLMIFMPPRCGKSLLGSQMFPAWYLGRHPERQVISASMDQHLANTFGRQVRNLINQPEFKKVFPRSTLAADSKAAGSFHTTRGGVYFAAGIGAGTVGRGAHLLNIDDPVRSRQAAESRLFRERQREWFRSVAYTRLMPGGAIVLTLTRWHEDDLAGWALKELEHENWHVLSLPAIAEREEVWRFRNGESWTRQPGEPLWPEWFPLEALEKIKQTLGTVEWSAQCQQHPTPSEGGLVHLDWFQRYVTPPSTFEIKRVVISLDTGTKDGELNDPSAAGVWLETDRGYFRVDGFAGRLQYPDLRRAISPRPDDKEVRGPGLVERVRLLYGKLTALLIEDKGSGSVLIQELRRETTLPVLPQMPRESKLVRFQGVTPLIEAGRVWLPEQAPWLIDYEQELLHFPNGAHDDQVDETSQALAWFQGPAQVGSGQLRQWRKR